MKAYGIQDFKSGLDLRKSYVTAPAGSLRVLRNCFISAGAEVEKRTMFLPWGRAPDSVGILSRNGEIFVIRAGPSGITDWIPTNPGLGTATPGFITLPLPAQASWRLADWDLFNGHFYIVMQGADGRYYHYFDQVLVGDPMATSSSVRTYGSKMYGVDGRLLRFSAINDPSKWTPPTGTTNDGSGYIDLSAQDADSTNLIGMEVYYGQMAIFSTLSTQFWSLDPDPAQNQFRQLLRSTGLIATNGLSQFGNGDVIYLSSHGIRSLKVQNVSLTAGTTDVGTPIDEAFRDLLIANGPAWFAQARCLIQPRSGRLFVVLPDRIYVLSTFQEPAITAWSSFDAPFGFVDSCVADPWIALRGGDGMIYLYGSDVLAAYDNTLAEIITPALALDNPSTNKLFHGFDIGAEGNWSLAMGLDPNNQATEEPVGTYTGATFNETEMTMPGQGTHISLRFRTTDASRARLGSVMILYDDGEED